MSTTSPPLDQFAEELVARIRSLRQRANLTQDELARKLKVTTRTVQAWESGVSIPRPSHRRKLDRFEERLRAREEQRGA